MSKKINKYRKNRSGGKGREEKGSRSERDSQALQVAILRFLAESVVEEVPLREINRFFQDQGWPKKSVTEAIDRLFSEQLLSGSGKQNLRINPKTPVYSGVISQHPRGFGFVTPAPSSPGSPRQQKDIFIPLRGMGQAHHGDTVDVLVTKKAGKERSEGTVLRIISEAHPVIAGIVQRQDNRLIVVPDDNRFPFFVTIDDQQKDTNKGDAVIVEYRRPQQSSRAVPGRILRSLGNYRRTAVQQQLVIEKFSLNDRFSDEVLAEAENLQQPVRLEDGRLDLRDTPHITIDGEDARDFDDAIHVQKTRNGYRLFVSIADVGFFVVPGSELDQEAFKRGTSIYFPGSVLPMLPERLSNNLCSLVPDEDRLCVSAILDFDREGVVRQERFVRSVIRSRQRFTYTIVHAIAGLRDKQMRLQYKEFCLQLKWAFELAERLRSNRLASGSIDFNLPEPFFTLSAEGEVEDISQSERNSAHRLIEEFMLAANQAVARFLDNQHLPAIFRIHEPPEEIKLAPFLNFIKTLDLQLPPFTNTPGWFAQLLAICRNTKTEYIINNLSLRLMQQARYSGENKGHFGLATSHYVHFTSPIRRYPDLMIHRLLAETITKQPLSGKKTPNRKKTALQAVSLSQREREAINAEREMHDRLKAVFMEKHLGETFTVIVSMVTDSTLYVELQERCISGSIEVSFLRDDYYIFDEKHYRLFGEITGKTIQIGDSLEVELVGVDIPGKRIFFQPVVR